MITLTFTLGSTTEGFSFDSPEEANDFLTEIKDYYTNFKDPDIGAVITPLPPGKDHSATGLITPKSPVQVAREQALRLNDMPKELFDPDEILYPVN
jgi:hypothetical protein